MLSVTSQSDHNLRLYENLGDYHFNYPNSYAYNMYELIINEIGYPFTVSTVPVIFPYLSVKKTVKLLYLGYTNANYVYYLSLSNDNVNQFNFSLSFKLNFTIDH